MPKLLYEFRRVLRVARKPSKDEYKEVSKVTGLGILLVGGVGFLIMMIGQLISGL